MLDQRLYRPCPAASRTGPYRHYPAALVDGHRTGTDDLSFHPVSPAVKRPSDHVTSSLKTTVLSVKTTAARRLSLSQRPFQPSEPVKPSAQSFESLIESELKAFGLESDVPMEDDETIDFYCSEHITDLKKTTSTPAEDIDEGFFDKPGRQETSLRIQCVSPPTPLSL